MLLWALPWTIHCLDLNMRQEFGRSAVATLFDEEEDDASFSFSNTKVSLEHRQDQGLWRAAGVHRERNYKTRDTDYEFNRWKLESWGRAYFFNRELRSGAELSWWQRNFDRPALADYRETRASFFVEETQNWNARLLLATLNYPQATHENKVGLKVSKEHEVDRWSARATAQSLYHDIENSNRWRLKQEVWGRFFLKAPLENMETLGIEATAGQRDSKEDEDREDNTDYSFWKTAAEGRHLMSERFRSRWTFGYSRKEDHDRLFSHRGLHGRLAAMTVPAQESLSYGGFLGFKKMDFIDRPILDYNKFFVGVEGSAPLNNQWKTRADVSGEFYDFKNQNRTNAKAIGFVALERKIRDGLDLTLSSRWRGSLVSVAASTNLSF